MIYRPTSCFLVAGVQSTQGGRENMECPALEKKPSGQKSRLSEGDILRRDRRILDLS